MLGAFLIALASCNPATLSNNDPKNDIDKNDTDVLDKVRSLDLSPRNPQQIGTENLPTGKSARPAVYNGVEVADVADGGAQTQNQAQSSGGGFDLNFENTPVSTVAKVVLGDILRVGYMIDPRVQGTITLASVRPVPKADILFVLEGALRTGGVVLVRDTSGYRLVPLADAQGSGNVEAGSNQEAGYGITVVPLQYVSAPTLLKLLDSFALKPGTIRADPRRNMLLIQGTGVERRTAVDAALSFDVDWMRGQSVGIFPIANGNPEPIIAELEKIMDAGDSGLGQNVVKFQPISRMNAIMVITPKPAALSIAATWIKRLDSANTSNSVHVYQVKYGDARQIARLLTDMFIGGSSASSTDLQGQLAPGAGATATSSADRLSANSGQPQTGGFGSQQSSGLGSQQGGGGLGGGLGGQQGGGGLGTNNRGTASGGTGLGGLSSAGGSGAGSKPILEGVRITPDVVNNTLLIYADQENYRLVEGTLRQVDRPQLQVAIDATIAEVTLNDSLAYGVQSFITSKQLGLKTDQGSIANTAGTTATTSAASTAGAVASSLISRTVPGFNFLVGSEAQPAVILNALNTLTSTKVLSTPSIVVIDNQVATLQVGDSVPVSTGSATVLTTSNTVVNTINYQNTGIILRVSPRVNANGNVRLDIEQEISNVEPTTAASLTPTISERKVKSSISVTSGQTVLLAGLISEERDGNRSGIPLLDDLPYIGGAFGQQGKTGQRTELIIFIRPQIIRDGTDAHYVAEELRAKLRGTMKANVENVGKHGVQ